MQPDPQSDLDPSLRFAEEDWAQPGPGDIRGVLCPGGTGAVLLQIAPHATSTPASRPSRRQISRLSI